MTHNEFIDRYLGKPVDFDGLYGAQCVDLARMYIKEVLGVSLQPEGVTGAAEFFTKHESRPRQKAAFDCIPYTGSVQPPQGALLVFGPDKENGNYGHIAVCHTTTHRNVTVYEQDGIENLKALKENRPQKGVYENTRGYGNLLGWLVPKAA